jgi:hypothetical protein
MGGKIMSKENKEDLQKLNEEKLADDMLEQVSGGHIEIEEDDPTCSANGMMVTKGITSSGGPWA